VDAYRRGLEEGHQYGAWVYKANLEADSDDEDENWLSDLEDDDEINDIIEKIFQHDGSDLDDEDGNDLDTKIAGGVTVKTQKESRAQFGNTSFPKTTEQLCAKPVMATKRCPGLTATTMDKSS